MPSTIKISELALVTNMQSIGPMFVSGAVGKITPDIGMLLAARLIITTGIGNTSAKTHELYGPIPVPEISEEDYLCYLFSSDMKQKPIPGSEFSTGKGTLIFCVIFEDNLKNVFHPHQKVIEKVLETHIDSIDFSESITGMITPEIKENSERILKLAFNEINSKLIIALEYAGGSLFDIGFLVNLPNKLSAKGKMLIQQPKGWLEEKLTIDEDIEKLLAVGLLVREVRDGRNWLIPQ